MSGLLFDLRLKMRTKDFKLESLKAKLLGFLKRGQQ